MTGPSGDPGGTMHCKNCNTRLSGTERHCPNCGRAVQGPGVSESQKPRVEASVLAPSAAALEMELDVEVEEQPPNLASKKKGRKAKPAPRGPSTGGSSPFTLDPAELRARLGEQPELLEAGLSVVCDEKGRPVGAGYSTDIGDIDLLARDESGALVVVMVAERDPDRDPVAEVLDRIGWVAKHVAKAKQEVRAILLLEPPPQELSYAAQAVAATVAFKTYRVALTFDDLEI